MPRSTPSHRFGACSLFGVLFMAATFPLERVEASRRLKANSNLEGNARTGEFEKKPWGLSVKLLINLPQVLEMMDVELRWPRRLGDALVFKQKDLKAAVQRLRAKARAEGNLKNTTEQRGAVEETVIVIELAEPTVIYVPTYHPTIVCGTGGIRPIRGMTTTRHETHRRSPAERTMGGPVG